MTGNNLKGVNCSYIWSDTVQIVSPIVTHPRNAIISRYFMRFCGFFYFESFHFAVGISQFDPVLLRFFNNGDVLIRQ